MSIYKYDEWLLNIKIITCNISDIILTNYDVVQIQHVDYSLDTTQVLDEIENQIKPILIKKKL
jgi:hypothetical protein